MEQDSLIPRITFDQIKDYFPMTMGSHWKYSRVVRPEKYPMIINRAKINREGQKKDTTIFKREKPVYLDSLVTYLVSGSFSPMVELSGEGIEPYNILQPPTQKEWYLVNKDDQIEFREIKTSDLIGSTISSVVPDKTGRLGLEEGTIPQKGIGVYNTSRVAVVGKYTSFIDTIDNGLFSFRSDFVAGTIETEAGTFSDLLLCTKSHLGEDESKNFRIERFFSPGIGLVKEIQFDGAGDTIYVQELAEYYILDQDRVSEIEGYIKGLGSLDTAIINSSYKALLEIEKDAGFYLIQVLSGPNNLTKLLAIKLLGEQKEDRAFKEIQRIALADKNENIRRGELDYKLLNSIQNEAFLTYLKIEESFVPELMKQLFNDTAEESWNEAAYYLANLKNKNYMKELRRAHTKSVNPEIRKNLESVIEFLSSK